MSIDLEKTVNMSKQAIVIVCISTIKRTKSVLEIHFQILSKKIFTTSTPFLFA